MITVAGLAFFISFFVSILVIRKTLNIEWTRNGVTLIPTQPTSRSYSHIRAGGITILSSVMFTTFLLLPSLELGQFRYTMICSTIMFCIGFIDELIGIHRGRKLIIQFLVAMLISWQGNLRFELFPQYALLNIGITITFILFLVNAFSKMERLTDMVIAATFFIAAIMIIAVWNAENKGYIVFATGFGGSIAAIFVYSRIRKMRIGKPGLSLLGFISAILLIELTSSTSGQVSSLVHISLLPVIIISFIVILFSIPYFSLIFRRSRHRQLIQHKNSHTDNLIATGNVKKLMVKQDLKYQVSDGH